jgi:hypothetical protein
MESEGSFQCQQEAASASLSHLNPLHILTSYFFPIWFITFCLSLGLADDLVCLPYFATVLYVLFITSSFCEEQIEIRLEDFTGVFR